MRSDRDPDFEQPGARKSQLWIDICNKMREAGYDFTPEKVSKKWHNITITYHKNNEKKHGTINWEFYHELHEFYQHKKAQEYVLDDDTSSEPKQQNTSSKRKFVETVELIANE